MVQLGVTVMGLIVGGRMFYLFSFHLVIDLFGEWRLMVMAVCGGGRWKEGARSPPGDYGGEGKAEEVLRKKKPSQLPREES